MKKIITPVVTPFKEDESPDYEATKQIIDFLIEGGVDGILVLGSTGEFTNLSFEERAEYLKFYAEYTAGRTELYAGTGGMSKKHIVSLTNQASELGYRASLIIGPYYYGIQQEQLFAYYDEIAKSTEADLLIYNFPKRTGHTVNSDTVARLAEANHNIIGMKDSVLEPNHTGQISAEMRGKEFQLYSGFDNQFLFNVTIDGAGCIGGLSNIIPEIWSALVRAENNGQHKEVFFLASLVERLMPVYSFETNASLLLKKLMVCRGLAIREKAIFPYHQCKEEDYIRSRKLLEEVLREFNNWK
ncbi:dihydrodipicolinate synthase family protein [Lachnospiraceae bacterium 42-17]|jgi:dihydrodipicolinate synthase/N-acetylneuraminate lyase|nr:dihydrodipicolinate synthase family protein [Dorea sp.]